MDLGCADGTLGQILKKTHGCQVVGVENNKRLVKIAKTKLDKVIFGDIDAKTTLDKIAKEPKFDVIFASAIFEHLKRPTVVVKKLSKSLKNDGFLLITLPNIAFWQIRINLLRGNFNYTDSGILDKTHLRFFTTKTALEFLKDECGLKIVRVEFEFPKTPLLHRTANLIPYFGTILESFIYRNFSNLFAYQILIIASPK